ncbi:hypothetical protein V8C42DRAFT_335425 [Trichoderma barbatum]
MAQGLFPFWLLVWNAKMPCARRGLSSRVGRWPPWCDWLSGALRLKSEARHRAGKTWPGGDERWFATLVCCDVMCCDILQGSEAASHATVLGFGDGGPIGAVQCECARQWFAHEYTVAVAVFSQ